MGVRLIWYGCPPASMSVSTPTVEYNYPPMVDRFLSLLTLAYLISAIVVTPSFFIIAMVSTYVFCFAMFL